MKPDEIVPPFPAFLKRAPLGVITVVYAVNTVGGTYRVGQEATLLYFGHDQNNVRVSDVKSFSERDLPWNYISQAMVQPWQQPEPAVSVAAEPEIFIDVAPEALENIAESILELARAVRSKS